MGFAEFWVFAVIFLFLVLSRAAITVLPGRAVSSFHVIIWEVRAGSGASLTCLLSRQHPQHPKSVGIM